jgi:hypothetical protein
MSQSQETTRPSFEEANRAWKQFLQQRGFHADLTWIFGDNLCFEEDASRPAGYRLGYQTKFSPPPPEAERIAYDYFIDFDAPVVFYRLGFSGNKSVCLLLCDDWFDGKGEAEGFWHREKLPGLKFRPGENQQVEEITDAERWQNRLIRPRPLHDLDFCMDLRGIHEILAHGRVLSTYEHYALKLLHVWRRIFEERGHHWS